MFVVVTVALAASVVVAVRPARDTAAACPAGYTSYAELEAREQQLGATEQRAEADEGELEGLCISNKHPESLAELSIMRSERV